MFFIKKCVVKLCALERDGTLSHLQTQMVVKFQIWSLKMLNKVLNEQLRWDDPKKALDGHVMHCKQLRNTWYYTFISMVDY